MLDRAVLCVVDRHLDNLLFWAIVKSADVNICVYVCIFLGSISVWCIYLGMELLFGVYT